MRDKTFRVRMSNEKSVKEKVMKSQSSGFYCSPSPPHTDMNGLAAVLLLPCFILPDDKVVGDGDEGNFEGT